MICRANGQPCGISKKSVIRLSAADTTLQIPSSNRSIPSLRLNHDLTYLENAPEVPAAEPPITAIPELGEPTIVDRPKPCREPTTPPVEHPNPVPKLPSKSQGFQRRQYARASGMADSPSLCLRLRFSSWVSGRNIRDFIRRHPGDLALGAAAMSVPDHDFMGRFVRWSHDIGGFRFTRRGRSRWPNRRGSKRRRTQTLVL